MFFDLGVFAAVVGATLLILTALAHQSIRNRRKPLPDAVAGTLSAEAS
jgi:multicomponent K+:H+ antiporter subunit A